MLVVYDTLALVWYTGALVPPPTKSATRHRYRKQIVLIAELAAILNIFSGPFDQPSTSSFSWSSLLLENVDVLDGRSEHRRRRADSVTRDA